MKRRTEEKRAAAKAEGRQYNEDEDEVEDYEKDSSWFKAKSMQELEAMAEGMF